MRHPTQTGQRVVYHTPQDENEKRQAFIVRELFPQLDECYVTEEERMSSAIPGQTLRKISDLIVKEL